MKHEAGGDPETLAPVLSAAGIIPSPAQLERLHRYARWLTDEAVGAGGIGPHEAGRIWNRHIADAAAYAIVASGPPDRFVDIGTGVGLPGLVLAILWPESEALLVDRSGRRVDLVRRAARVCGVENVRARQASHSDLDDDWPLIVSRATLPAPVVAAELRPLLQPGGVGVVGLHRGATPTLPPADDRTEVVTIPQLILDPPAWFLKIFSRG